MIELPEQDIKKLGQYTAELSRDVQSLQVVHHVRHDRESSAIICKVKPRGSLTNLDELKFRFKRFEILSEEKDGVIVYVEAEAAPLITGAQNSPKVYLNFPFEIREGVRRVTFLGEAAELQKLFNWLKRRKIKFEVLSNSGGNLESDSYFSGLTPHQRTALLSAYTNGYYEVPRKVNLDKLARNQKVNKSTFAEHLLKAENTLISRIVAEELKKSPGEGPASK